MSHYNDLEAAKAYNEKLEKKYAFNTTVPVGNTSGLFNTERNTIDDALGFCNGGLRSVDDPNYEIKKFSECSKETVQPACNTFGVEINKHLAEVAKKETKYKAPGARYCYLSSIASASAYAGCPEDHIGKYLDKLLDFDFRMEGSTQHIFNMIIFYCGLAIGSDEDLWDGVIAVRLHGVRSGKYSVGNHKLPMNKDLLLDAAARHLIAYLYIDHIDQESGESHLCHIVANILMFAAQLNISKGE